MKSKTHSGAKKRFKVSGGKKLRYEKAAHNHLMFGKSKRQKDARKAIALPASEDKRVREMLRIGL